MLRLTGGDGVDHVVETAGDLTRSVACLRVGGLVSTLGYVGQLDLENGSPADWTYTTPVIPMLVRNVRLQALSCAPRESFERMFDAMAAAELRPVIDRVFPFEQSGRGAPPPAVRGSTWGRCASTSGATLSLHVTCKARYTYANAARATSAARAERAAAARDRRSS